MFILKVKNAGNSAPSYYEHDDIKLVMQLVDALEVFTKDVMYIEVYDENNKVVYKLDSPYWN